jgi:hypothetical protein
MRRTKHEKVLWTRAYNVTRRTSNARVKSIQATRVVILTLVRYACDTRYEQTHYSGGSASHDSKKMQTYSAALAPWRMAPLHPLYVQRARHHAELITRNSGAVREYRECLCPYCGRGDMLEGTVKVGAKEHVYNVPITATGFFVPKARGRPVELLVIYCRHPDCHAVIDSLAYYSPVAFYLDKENTSLLEPI